MGQQLEEYLAYWSLKESPFHHTNQSIENIFFPNEWQSLLDRLMFFCERSTSFIMLMSEAGHCKSTIARWLQHSLDHQRHEVILLSLFHNEKDSGWLIPRIVEFLGPTKNNHETMAARLGESMTHLQMENRLLTVIIDEAHKLETEASLQDIHSLVSLESLTSTGINVVLLGNPSLKTILKSSESIKNRINLSLTFPPLTLDQIQLYLLTHLDRIGLDQKTIRFDALSKIQYYSGGLFSRLNALIENCLIEAFLRKEKTIHSETVQVAAGYLPAIEPSKLNHAELKSENMETSKAKGSAPNLRSEATTLNKDQVEEIRSRSSSIELKRLFYQNELSKNKKESAS